MDAELSRATARVFNSPLWAYTALQKGGKFSDGLQTYRQRITDECVKAVTLTALPEPMQAYFNQCDRSYEIAAQKFAGRSADLLEASALQMIAEALAAPVEDEA